MGSWYDYLKGLPKPDYVTIRPHEDGLEVSLQYKNETKRIILKEDAEVSFYLRGLNVSVSKGEKWGDWGGACKVGDVVYVSKPDKLLILPEKVVFS
jgi:hypothetical protein